MTDPEQGGRESPSPNHSMSESTIHSWRASHLGQGHPFLKHRTVCLRSVARIKCCDSRLDFPFKPLGKFSQVAFVRRIGVEGGVRLGEADRKCGGSRLQCESSDGESPCEKISTVVQGRVIHGMAPASEPTQADWAEKARLTLLIGQRG